MRQPLRKALSLTLSRGGRLPCLNSSPPQQPGAPMGEGGLHATGQSIAYRVCADFLGSGLLSRGIEFVVVPEGVGIALAGQSARAFRGWPCDQIHRLHGGQSWSAGAGRWRISQWHRGENTVVLLEIADHGPGHRSCRRRGLQLPHRQLRTVCRWTSSSWPCWLATHQQVPRIRGLQFSAGQATGCAARGRSGFIEAVHQAGNRQI